MGTLSSSSSHNQTTRAQTEPLAALVAVGTIAIAIGFYGGFFTDVVNTETDRDVSEPTLANVWHVLGEDGVYTTHELGTTTIPESVLPDEYNVYVNVTVLQPNGWTTIDAVQYDGDGYTVGSPTRISNVQSFASFASRAIPYQTDDGQVRSVRLNVVMWAE